MSLYEINIRLIKEAKMNERERERVVMKQRI
jgi:hypothetical protein